LNTSREGVERRNDAAQACTAVRRCPDKLSRRRKFSRGRLPPSPHVEKRALAGAVFVMRSRNTDLYFPSH